MLNEQALLRELNLIKAAAVDKTKQTNGCSDCLKTCALTFTLNKTCLFLRTA